MKNLKLWLAFAAAMLSLGSLGISIAYVQAGSTFSWSRVEDKTADKLAAEIQAPLTDEAPLGAVTGPNLPNPYIVGDEQYQIVSGSFIDASTTIVSFPSPFLKATSTGAGSEKVVFTNDAGTKFTSATTTLTLAQLWITAGATTSFRLACGATSTPVGGSLVTSALYPNPIVSTTPVLAGDSIPTSSVGLIENNLTQSAGAIVGSGTVSKITLNSATPYLTCVVDPVTASGFTNPSNTFDGKYYFLVHRPRL